MNEFKEGQLIIPNNNLHEAFYYWKAQMDLYEKIVYRVATTRERIYYEKNIASSKESTNTISAYKSKMSKKVSEMTSPKKGDKPHGNFQ